MSRAVFPFRSSAKQSTREDSQTVRVPAVRTNQEIIDSVNDLLAPPRSIWRARVVLALYFLGALIFGTAICYWLMFGGVSP